MLTLHGIAMQRNKKLVFEDMVDLRVAPEDQIPQAQFVQLLRGLRGFLAPTNAVGYVFSPLGHTACASASRIPRSQCTKMGHTYISMVVFTLKCVCTTMNIHGWVPTPNVRQSA